MTDEISNHNKERWEELAQAGVEFSRPWLNLDVASARQEVDPHDVMGDVRNKSVLCLAGGGGQQSVAFALLEATVTVLDVSETQLERDRQALAHYGLQARLEQRDMRDLALFAKNSFDVVWQAWSINFIPDISSVFDEVKRVLKSGGLYRLQWGNPFLVDMDEKDWTGDGYLLRWPYRDGEKMFTDPDWEIQQPDGTVRRVPGPREFNHKLSTVVNGLIQRGFQLRGLWEDELGNPAAPPGAWEHLKTIAPRELTIWATYSG